MGLRPVCPDYPEVQATVQESESVWAFTSVRAGEVASDSPDYPVFALGLRPVCPDYPEVQATVQESESVWAFTSPLAGEVGGGASGWGRTGALSGALAPLVDTSTSAATGSAPCADRAPSPFVTPSTDVRCPRRRRRALRSPRCGRDSRCTCERMPTLWQAVTTAPTPATRPSSLQCSNSGPKSSGAPPMTVFESPTITSSFLALEIATLTRLGSLRKPIAARSLERTRDRITASDSRPSKASTDSTSSGGTMPLSAPWSRLTCELYIGVTASFALRTRRRMIEVMSLHSATSNSFATDRCASRYSSWAPVSTQTSSRSKGHGRGILGCGASWMSLPS